MPLFSARANIIYIESDCVSDSHYSWDNRGSDYYRFAQLDRDLLFQVFYLLQNELEWSSLRVLNISNDKVDSGISEDVVSCFCSSKSV